MIGPWIRTAWLVALAGSFYAASGPVDQLAAQAIGVPCLSHGLQLACDLPPDGALSQPTYALSALALATAWLASTLWLRNRPAQPFIGLFAALGLAAIAYDAAVGRPLVTGERLINDTFDVLRFLIFASFALLVLIARRWILSSWSVAVAAAASFTAATVSMIVFYLVRPGLIGAFELYVLYIAYAFGGFTLHLMTLSRLVARARPGLVGRGDLHDLAGREAGQVSISGRRGHDGRAHQGPAHHAVHLGAGGVHGGEPAREALVVAAAGVDHFAQGHLAQAVAFRGGDEIGSGRGAGAEQNG
jgi:hypothetical protein